MLGQFADVARNQAQRNIGSEEIADKLTAIWLVGVVMTIMMVLRLLTDQSRIESSTSSVKLMVK